MLCVEDYYYYYTLSSTHSTVSVFLLIYSHNVSTLCIRRIRDTFTFSCINRYGYDKTNVGIMKGPCPLSMTHVKNLPNTNPIPYN